MLEDIIIYGSVEDVPRYTEIHAELCANGGIILHGPLLQSDWNQTNQEKPDYIKNKPTIGDGTITIVQKGFDDQTFTTNQVDDKTITIEPTSWGNIVGDIEDNQDLSDAFDAKQDTLVSGENIKKINGQDVIGEGEITIETTSEWGSITGTLSSQTDLKNALDSKQNTIEDLDDIKSGAEAGSTALQPDDLADWAKAETKPSYTAEEVGALAVGYHDDSKQDSISDLDTIRSGASAGATALQDAPSDNKQYARKDGEWAVVESADAPIECSMYFEPESLVEEGIVKSPITIIGLDDITKLGTYHVNVTCTIGSISVIKFSSTLIIIGYDDEDGNFITISQQLHGFPVEFYPLGIANPNQYCFYRTKSDVEWSEWMLVGHLHNQSDISGLGDSLSEKQDKINDLESIRTGASAGASALQPNQIADWAKADTKPSYSVSEISGAQASLVSGTNIKTINNQSILGEGNIVVQGGGGASIDDSTTSLTSTWSSSKISSSLSGVYIHKGSVASVGDLPQGQYSDASQYTRFTATPIIENGKVSGITIKVIPIGGAARCIFRESGRWINNTEQWSFDGRVTNFAGNDTTQFSSYSYNGSSVSNSSSITFMFTEPKDIGTTLTLHCTTWATYATDGSGLETNGYDLDANIAWNLSDFLQIGDVYNTEDTGMNYAWNGSEWDALGPSIDGKADKVLVADTEGEIAVITPNIFYKFGEVETLMIELNDAPDPLVLNEYMFEFTSGPTPTTLIIQSTMPDGTEIKWNSAPTIVANTRYQVSIVDGIALIVGGNDSL